MGHPHGDKHFKIQGDNPTGVSRVREELQSRVKRRREAGRGGQREGRCRWPRAGSAGQERRAGAQGTERRAGSPRPGPPRRSCRSPDKFGGSSSPRLNHLCATSARRLPKESRLCCCEEPSSRRA